MATSVPTALKSADISRFAMRATQVEKAKPALAYWCYYWVVNQILSKGLHQTDDECMTYTMTLMDKLEQLKQEHAQDDAVIDDIAGQAYTEQFGLETFARADNAVRANKASRQTADTFQAAATFLELSHIWGSLDDDIASKIKFAKYHALRIAKALKAGEDPNLTNPAPEPISEQQQSQLDPNGPEVQALSGTDAATSDPHASRQPSVEEVPDEHDRLQPRLARISTLDQSLHPSRAPSIPRPSGENYTQDSSVGRQPPQSGSGEDFYKSVSQNDVSPLAPQDDADTSGYFPRVPEGYSDESHLTLPETPSQRPGSSSSGTVPYLPPRPKSPPRDVTGSSNTHQPTSFVPPAAQPPQTAPMDVPRYPPPPQQPSYPSYPPPSRTISSQSAPRGLSQASTAPLPPRTSAPRLDSGTNYVADEEAIMKAQKHARWAISALNFEDVNTAVKELRGALNALGAS